MYTGDWKEDEQHGYGQEQWPDGAKYEGFYDQGRKHGRGKLIFPEGSYYDGEF